MFHRPVRAEPIAVVAELCLTDGFQDLLDALLHQSVPDAGNTQRPGFSVWLWDVLPAHWFGTVAVFAACDGFSDLADDLSRWKPSNVTDILLVCFCCVAACVGLDVSVGQHDVVRA